MESPVRTIGEMAAALNRSPVYVSGLQKRFELPVLVGAPYSPAYEVFLRGVIALRTLNVPEETVRALWHLEKKLLQDDGCIASRRRAGGWGNGAGGHGQEAAGSRRVAGLQAVSGLTDDSGSTASTSPSTRRTRRRCTTSSPEKSQMIKQRGGKCVR